MAKLSYSQKLLDPRWQQMRLRVYERDGFRCRICKCETKTLNAHHVHYHPYADGPWDYDIESIITLCSDCHSDEHQDLESSKANVIHALNKIGFCTGFEFDCLYKLLDGLTIQDLIRLYRERQNG